MPAAAAGKPNVETVLAPLAVEHRQDALDDHQRPQEHDSPLDAADTGNREAEQHRRAEQK